MTIERVLYASNGMGVHDRRWVAALADCGFDVEVCAGGEAIAGLKAREPLHDGFDDAPVLAGPLDAVTRQIVGIPRPVIGLSWGYDLQQGHAMATPLADLGWIQELDGLVVDSPATRDLAASLGLANERIALLPWGVDVDLFTPVGPRVTATDLGFAHGSRIILSLRTHDDLYRTVDVIEAFASASAVDHDLVLVMGGDGPLNAEHRARVDQLGIAARVAFTGWVAEHELPALLRGAHLYVTASETDGSSVTLMQAMACGTPIAASANPGNDWWVEDGVTGREFEVGDVAGLAALMVDRLDTTGQVSTALERVRERGDWSTNRLQLREVMRMFRRQPRPPHPR